VSPVICSHRRVEVVASGSSFRPGATSNTPPAGGTTTDIGNMIDTGTSDTVDTTTFGTLSRDGTTNLSTTNTIDFTTFGTTSPGILSIRLSASGTDLGSGGTASGDVKYSTDGSTFTSLAGWPKFTDGAGTGLTVTQQTFTQYIGGMTALAARISAQGFHQTSPTLDGGSFSFNIYDVMFTPTSDPSNHNRPTTNTNFTGGTPANAYDTSGSTVDTGTSTGAMTTGGIGTGATYQAFQGTGTVSGILNIRGMTAFTDGGGSVSALICAASTWEVSTDGGTNWSTPVGFTGSMAIHKFTLTHATVSSIVVRLTSKDSSGGSIKLGTDWLALGNVQCSDVVILTT